MTQSICLAWIVVPNLEEAIKYYTEVVGLKLLEHHKEFHWAELSADSGAKLGIAQESDFCDIKSGGNAVLALGVEDVDAAKKRIAKGGTELIGDICEVPGEVKLQTFKDPYGNHWQLAQKLR